MYSIRLILISLMLSTVTITHASTLQSLINYPATTRHPTWLGADIATSIQLSSHRYLWLFGDTLVGTSKAGRRQLQKIIPNSIGIMMFNRQHQPQPIKKYLWSFKLRQQANDIWVFDGVRYQHKLILLGQIINPKNRLNSLGNVLIVVSNPDRVMPTHWHYRVIAIPHYKKLNLSSALVLHAGKLMLFAESGSGLRAKTKVLQLNVTDALRSNWQLARLVNVAGLPGTSEMAIDHNRQYAWYTLQIRPGTDSVRLYTATTLLGPWHDRGVIFTIPKRWWAKQFIAYAVKAHPELSQTTQQIVFTYNININPFAPNNLKGLTSMLKGAHNYAFYTPQFGHYK